MSSFYMPVRVFEEEEAVLRHAKDIKKLVPEGGCALIVTGRHSTKANGSYADVCTALESVGIRHVLFDEVEENPSTDTVMKARDLGVSENADLVIGIGGGSPLDAAKAIDRDKYTEASLAALDTQLQNAEAALQNADLTQTAVNLAARRLNNAIAALQEKPVPQKTKFVDVPDDAYYAAAVDWAVESM